MQEIMGEEASVRIGSKDLKQKRFSKAFCGVFCAPLNWFRMIAEELHWTFVLGVIVVYGVSQGLGGALGRVGADYYWKDVQKIQPSEAQVYQGVTYIPWIIKPLWGLLTDVVPIAGYRRRPYFALAGFIGMASMLIISLQNRLPTAFALLSLTAGSAGIAIADVTVDACVAQNSIKHPHFAGDMQSLCGLSSSIGGLLGFSLSGLLVHLIGSQGVLGLLSIPAALLVFVGALLSEAHMPDFTSGEVYQRLLNASKSIFLTLKCSAVWRPCLYMYLSLALSLSIHQGMFFWYTDSTAGPSFSQEIVGFIFSVGSMGSLLGVLLYQSILKEYTFRALLFWSQLLFGLSGMLDLMLVLQLNVKLGMPDYLFVVIDEGVSHMIGRLKWMPLLVLSSKLCPPGIEGTFFALLMSIDNLGLLTSSSIGGLLLHTLKVTRTEFSNLWVAILVRNIIRILPLTLLFLVPKADQHSSIFPDDMLNGKEDGGLEASENHELVTLIGNTN